MIKHMKKITLSALLLAATTFMSGQTITQSQSQEIVEGTVSCNGGGVATAENSYFRSFDLSSFNITDAYTVSAVEFGIEQVANGGSYPFTVKLYATTATFPAGFPDSGYTLIAEQTFDVPDQQASIYSAAITGTVPAGSDLVVEVNYQGDANESAVVFIGSNADGESGPTYIMAPDCGLTAPQTMSSIGFGDVNFVMNVIGTTSTAGLNENIADSVAVYPNPTNGIINIDMNNNVVLHASVTDVTGKSIDVAVNSGSINISAFTSGVYFLNLDTEKGTIVKKIVKK